MTSDIEGLVANKDELRCQIETLQKEKESWKNENMKPLQTCDVSKKKRIKVKRVNVKY